MELIVNNGIPGPAEPIGIKTEVLLAPPRTVNTQKAIYCDCTCVARPERDGERVRDRDINIPGRPLPLPRLKVIKSKY